MLRGRRRPSWRFRRTALAATNSAYTGKTTDPTNTFQAGTFLTGHPLNWSGESVLGQGGAYDIVDDHSPARETTAKS